MAKQLCGLLQDNSLFEDFESGFRKHHSTETALLKVTNDLFTASDVGLISVPVLILVQLLTLLIITSFYRGLYTKVALMASDRCNSVHVDDESSGYDNTSHGVPQASFR